MSGTADPSADANAGLGRRARFTVAYDGAAFHGFAEQPGAGEAAVVTVAGTLRAAFELVLQSGVQLTGAGRTDAGVHAWGQVISLDLPIATSAIAADLDGLTRRINRLCGPAITVRDAAWCTDPEFSARFDAQWRSYRYDVLNQVLPNPFLAGRTWHVRTSLDVAAMRLACDPLIGERDFTSFCRRPEVPAGHAPASLSRRVYQARWTPVDHDQSDGLLRFEIRANAFCHQMVRAIVGTLVEVGRGRMHAADVRALMLARSREHAPAVAPPHGLCLWAVGYPTEG